MFNNFHDFFEFVRARFDQFPDFGQAFLKGIVSERGCVKNMEPDFVPVGGIDCFDDGDGFGEFAAAGEEFAV